MSDETPPTISDEPHDRLTELCAQMTEVLNEPENNDIKAIVFLNDDNRGGIQTHGYDDPMEATADLFVHMRAIFRALGKELELIAIPESPEGLST
jgi:hypothetical protein